MKLLNGNEPANPSCEGANFSRRSLFKRASVAGASTAIAFSALPAIAAILDPLAEGQTKHAAALTMGDTNILIAAEVAEALAVTTYTHIVSGAPFFSRLPHDDQDYFFAARSEEMSHYLLEESAIGHPTPFTQFFYPQDMFADPQTTLNTLVTLEDAFIAAYLVGVRNFSTADLRVTAARIMGIESDHRTLARVVGGDVAAADGGPLTKIKGIQGVTENIDPPNNNGYERTLCWSGIDQALSALMPFVDESSAKAAGFSTKAFTFQPFTPHLPTPLGNFISFTGC